MKNRAKFLVFRGEDGQFYWHLQANNNEIVAQSEGYKTKQGAINGVKAVKAIAGFSPMFIEEQIGISD